MLWKIGTGCLGKDDRAIYSLVKISSCSTYSMTRLWPGQALITVTSWWLLRIGSFWYWKCWLSCNDSKVTLLTFELLVFIMKEQVLMLGPVRTSQNSVCFAKQSFKSKPFLVQTIFTYQNFLSVTKLQLFVTRQNTLFLDSYPSSAYPISRTWPMKVPMKISRVSGTNKVTKTRNW